MTDIANIENAEQLAGESLSPEKITNAVNLLRENLRKTISSWPEYKIARRLEGGAARELIRPGGQLGEGLWTIEDAGRYLKINVLSALGSWDITLQPGGKENFPYENPLISGNSTRKTKLRGREIIERKTPPRNTREALSLVVDFAKSVSGGKLPSNISRLASIPKAPVLTRAS